MTSIRQREEREDNALTENSRVTVSLAFVVIGFLVTGLIVFNRLEARVDVIDAQQKSDGDRLSRHESTEGERLQRMEDKIDRIIDRLGANANGVH